MINLKNILTEFTQEKQQAFLLYLEKKNKRKDTKNTQFVKLLIEDKAVSKEICFQLYGSDNKVAFHALRKRLFQSLIDFTATINLNEENSIDIQLIKYIISARAFLEKEQYEVGYKILDKALVIAKEHQLFTLLNEIYHTKIQYSYQITAIDIDALIIDFKENQKLQQLEEDLNIAYAKIRKKIISHNQKGVPLDIKTMVETILEEHQIAISSSFSFKSLYQLMQITSISSSQNYEYWNIEKFLISSYELLKDNKSKAKYLFYHIEILLLIANTLFRNKKFTESLYYLQTMYFYMKENKGKQFKTFHLKYYLAVALNYNYSGNQKKAIDLLEPFIDKKELDTLMQIQLFLFLTVFYVQNKSLKKAQKIFSQFYHTDKWYIEKAGIEWTIKKNLIEILLQIDLGNINIVDSRILSFKRNYYTYLKEINQEKVIHYLQLVETYYKNPEIVATKEFHEKVENSFDWIGKEKEDIFMMSFFAWLKAKMTKQDLYTVTLDIVTRS